MAANPAEIVAYFQNQPRGRGFYRGPIDGKFNPAVDIALSNYRQALGMSNEAVIDEAFFRAFLSADHSMVKAPPQPAEYSPVGSSAPPAAATSQAPAKGAASKSLVLHVAAEPNRTSFAVGEQINSKVRANRDVYIYCYQQIRDAIDQATGGAFAHGIFQFAPR